MLSQRVSATPSIDLRPVRAALLVLATLAVALMFAQAPAFAEKRFALVIGNGDYQGAGDLPNARNDAQLMEAALKAVGFETELLLDLTEEKMGEALDSLAERANSLDVVALYYAGHGLQKNNVNYLVPVDARIETETAIERETLTLQSFIDVLARVPVSMLFLDACRNNPFAEKLAEDAEASGRSLAVSRGLAVVRPVGDMLITFATLPNTVASDGTGENSPFATALARHVRTPDAEVSVLMKRVTRDVIEKTDGEQRPQQLSQMQREFYFQRTSGGEVTREEVRSVLSVYPDDVKTGEEVALVADVPPSCEPAFFDLSKSGKVTPIPLRFFKQVSLGNAQTRFEISPGSRYGLVVQEQDERGEHTLGFFCEPAGLDKPGKVALLKALVGEFGQDRLEGQVDAGGAGDVRFHFQRYRIN